MVVYILFYILIGVWQITQTRQSQEIQQPELEYSLTANIPCSENNCSYRNTSECKDEKGWNLYGSDWGCCGNYEGCCRMASQLCYIHDKICKCCRLGWLLCGPECQPEPYCSNYRTTKGEKGRKWLLNKLHKDYVIEKTKEFQNRIRYNITMEYFDTENGTDMHMKTDQENNSDSWISRHSGRHIHNFTKHELQNSKTTINDSFTNYDIHNNVQNKTVETTTLRMSVTRKKVRNSSPINQKSRWTETGRGFPGSFMKSITMKNSIHQTGTKSYTVNYPLGEEMKKKGQKHKLPSSNDKNSETKNDGFQKDSSNQTNIFDNIYYFFFSNRPSKTGVESNDLKQRQNDGENFEGSGEVDP